MKRLGKLIRAAAFLGAVAAAADDDALWSLFILNRHEVRTQCIILNDNK